jgi:hypothetical protein
MLRNDATRAKQESVGQVAEVVSEQVRSGQSVVAFCHERTLCAPHFFVWKNRLRAASARLAYRPQAAAVSPFNVLDSDNVFGFNGS